MTTQQRDPWVDVKTRHGLAADQVISALQKEIRRGHTETAAMLTYEMATTHAEAVAFADVAAALQVTTLGSAPAMPDRDKIEPMLEA
jgi:sugar/nucleoside kinase (ribokinase family)